MILLLLFFFHCVYCKYFYNHIIKTELKSVNELTNIMTSKKYFDLYLEEVKADNIVYDPCLNDSLLEYPFKVGCKYVWILKGSSAIFAAHSFATVATVLAAAAALAFLLTVVNGVIDNNKSEITNNNNPGPEKK